MHTHIVHEPDEAWQDITYRLICCSAALLFEAIEVSSWTDTRSAHLFETPVESVFLLSRPLQNTIHYARVRILITYALLPRFSSHVLPASSPAGCINHHALNTPQLPTAHSSFHRISTPRTAIASPHSNAVVAQLQPPSAHYRHD